MSYAQYRDAAAKVAQDLAALAAAAAAYASSEQQRKAALPFLGDDIFILIGTKLNARMLARLACTAKRFWRKSVADPEHKGAGAPQLWSVAEEGARRQLKAHSEQVRGWVSRWGGVGLVRRLRALQEVEKLTQPLRFTACHSQIVLSDSGACDRSALCLLGSVD